jgi:RNA recognition motif-containing protein
LGSATVVYETKEDADKAIEEYHNAQLDERVLIVEHDLSALLRVPRLKKPAGKTLRVGGGRGAAGRR